jgi:hypothetical protein
VVGAAPGVVQGVVIVPVLVVVTGTGTGVVLVGAGGSCECRESSSSWRVWPSWRSARNKSCKKAWRSCGNVLAAAPEDAALVPLVVGVVVVVAGVVGVPVVPDVPVPVAVAAEWLVTNCVNAESSAVYRLLPRPCTPPPWIPPPCTPPPESESPSLSALPAKLRVAPNKDDRLTAGLAPDTAFVVIFFSLFEMSTRRSRASPCGPPRSRRSSRPAAD